jgi:hypothetical protein
VYSVQCTAYRRTIYAEMGLRDGGDNVMEPTSASTLRSAVWIN